MKECPMLELCLFLDSLPRQISSASPLLVPSRSCCCSTTGALLGVVEDAGPRFFRRPP